MDKEFIEVKGKTLKLGLCITTFREGEFWNAYAPSLNINGYGDTEKEALKSFDVSLNLYIEWVLTHKTLEADLKKLGWKEAITQHTFNKAIPAKYGKSHTPYEHCYALT